MNSVVYERETGVEGEGEREDGDGGWDFCFDVIGERRYKGKEKISGRCPGRKWRRDGRSSR